MPELDREPSPGELAILNVLWKRGPSTVREVLRALSEGGEMAYTTVLKTMQIMHDKGLVSRDTSQRSHIYMPVHEPRQVRGGLISRLAERAFGGSASQLALHALAEAPVSRDELAELRSLLDRLEAEESP